MKPEKIPEFPEFTGVDLSHKEAIEECFTKAAPKASEFVFAEMFAWRKAAHISVSNLGGFLIFRYDKKGEKFITPPLCSEHITESLKNIFDFYKDKGEKILIKPVTDRAMEKAERTGEDFIIEDDRDNYDYVYEAESLAFLRGRKYSKKRNQIKKFNRNYDFEVSELTPDNTEKALMYLKEWSGVKQVEKTPHLKAETEAVKIMLENFDKLGIFGIILYVNGIIKGFTIGAELNSDTAVVLVEKADPEIKGIYQAINSIFAEKLAEKYKWINRQQDVGDEGLRRAKLSYYPHHFICKKKVRLK